MARRAAEKDREQVENKGRLTRKHENTISVSMKNVTITLPDEIARRARIAAAKEDMSLSRFVADLLQKRCDVETERAEKVALLWKFLDGPGFPGTSKAWPGREVLYGERADELLRRYKSAGIRGGFERFP